MNFRVIRLYSYLLALFMQATGRGTSGVRTSSLC